MNPEIQLKIKEYEDTASKLSELYMDLAAFQFQELESKANGWELGQHLSSVTARERESTYYARHATSAIIETRGKLNSLIEKRNLLVNVINWSLGYETRTTSDTSALRQSDFN